ncbi:ubiquitin carboxyl-terminal hydrolase 48-like isoform X2 [Planococcus citri]|uniref:ubiquitin carboxyl-terminal hydrolase 48-like isoform X2 n=1 Tax=Planococcus citri TaxID=170843 RepID=UPI0031F849C9
MAPTRKEQFEKNAWSWVENCHPSQVSDEHVQTAYRINLSRCKIGACRRNCKGNPFCLSSLGEQKWLGSHEDAAADHIYDPEKERRKPTSYVGLKNLGATCYVNSLLQLWFHNLNFRKAIFMWDPLQDPEEKQNITILEEKYIPLSVLGHLQAVFALMRYGERRFVDPTDFILSLRLDTSIQQDAQEFSKLFLSKLETTLSYQSAKEVRDLIKDNFCGEYSYVTRCMKCKMESKRPSTFYELDLNIKGHKTIQDCLKEFMNIEMLEGDDKYFCQICGEKQDAQRFISLTELPPVLNLQLMRFVFDKNTGYKKKLNTFVQFPDKLNMSEFCPNVKGDLGYTLSAVLVHGGRSANSGHYVAHICDSESGTWYKFNDESVEKIEGKKLKLGTEDEYEDGGKKMKLPRAPKGSYHSPNAYMLVYTRNDVASTPLRDEASKSDVVDTVECVLPPHLQNFVSDQNLQFQNWVTDVQKNNDMALGRNHFQQLEMATNITLLSAESGLENLEAIPTCWLTSWLSDPDLDGAVDNEKYRCCHGKLDPNQVSNVKYVNAEMADKLFDKYGGELRFKYGDFLCHDCVVAKCLKIRVKNQMQHESKIISNKLKSKPGDLETGYWVGKVSLRSWRRMAMENLENGIFDRHRVELLLNDTNGNASAGASRGMCNAATSTVSCKTEENFQSVTGGSEYAAAQLGLANGRSDCENSNCRPIGDAGSKSDVVSRRRVISKLEECYSLAAANKDDPFLRELCEPLETILDSVDDETKRNLEAGATTTPTTTTTAAATAATAAVSSYNGAFYNFLQNRDKSLQTNSANGGIAEMERTTKLGGGGNDSLSAFCEAGGDDGSGSGGGGDGGSSDADAEGDDRPYHRSHRRNDNGRDRDDRGYYEHDDDDDEDGGGDGDDDDDDADADEDDENEVTRHSDTDDHRRLRRRGRSRHSEHSPAQRAANYGANTIENDQHRDAIEASAMAAHRIDELQARLNGDAAALVKCDVDNEDDASNSGSKFNDDLLCFHGNLCVEENNRRLVSEEVWRLLKKYFPSTNEFTLLSQPCGLCKSIASEAEVAKDMYKTEAVNQKESLNDLYLDRNRPLLDYRHPVDADVENVFYIINKEFINSWRKFIRENGKKEPPYSIKNQSWLLCADHSKLLYDLNQRIPNTVVVITEKEWQLLCVAYNADCAISVKCLPNGTLITSPDVCFPCLRRRIEDEEKAQLCYSKAKIYIKVQNDEDTEYLSNEESKAPPTKRAKISANNGKTSNGYFQHMNGGSGVADAECREMDTEPNDAAAVDLLSRNSPDITSTSTSTSASASNGGPVAMAMTAAAAADPATAVRRSSRCRRVRGVKEIIVSSDLTLLDVKKKICEMMSVAPMDQHLFTNEGRSLTDNTATLTELSIYPETVLNLKVDEPCEGVIADEFVINREPEAGFKGTGLVGS